MSGPQFPRRISSVLSENRQKEVGYKDTAMLHYQGALWKDCRISAFYRGQRNPDVVFIDLDRKDFKNDGALKTALTKILKRIERKISGRPTVLWSGRGYHVIQPIKCDVDLDVVKEYMSFVRDKDVNKAFLQFAAYYLSGGKKDSCNRTSLKSCLLRIPGSMNSKNEGEVEVVQRWDGIRPDVRLMLGSFHSSLVAEKIEEDKRREKYANMESPPPGAGISWWIERLLQTPMDDYRQRARDLIIVPYLVVRRGITNIDEIEAIVMKWADMCNDVESLRPSYREFERALRRRIDRAIDYPIPPMSFDTLQERNRELAVKLSGSAGS